MTLVSISMTTIAITILFFLFLPHQRRLQPLESGPVALPGLPLPPLRQRFRRQLQGATDPLLVTLQSAQIAAEDGVHGIQRGVFVIEPLEGSLQIVITL